MAGEERTHRGHRVTVYAVADRSRVSVATVCRGRPVPFVGSPALATDFLERHEGFVAAHAERLVAKPLPAEPRESEGHRVADLILSGRVDAEALVCADDEVALAAMDRLTSSGVDVPRDLSIVGRDDVPAACHVRPRPTVSARQLA